MIKHGSLFSGIGGFDLAAQWCGWTNIFQVEKDLFCKKVLNKNFPNTERYGDIYEFKGERTKKYQGSVDVISGGFPCQPFSIAGKRKGKDDDRYLWPEMLRVISEIRPAWVVAENVTGIISMELDKTIFDLESIGYEVQIFIIPACAIGAPHRRDRVWIVANSDNDRLQRFKWCTSHKKKATKKEWINTKGIYCRKKPKWKDCISEPYVSGGNYGVSNRAHRTKALGNAIVPQVAYEIFRCIEFQSLF